MKTAKTPSSWNKAGIIPRICAFGVTVHRYIPCIRLWFESMGALKYYTDMNNLTSDIEMDIADAIMEKPIGFNIGHRHFCLYPPTLGKIYLLKRLTDALGINWENIKSNPYLEALRICKEKKELACRVIAYYTWKRKSDLLNDKKIASRAKLFNDELSVEETANLLVATTLWNSADVYIKHLGLDKEQELRRKIAKLKEKESCSLSFGGLSAYGTLIDFACQRYGWTVDYVVWGISYVNLQMLMADSLNSVYLNKEEMRKLHIPQDRTFISGDDPANMAKIQAMNWD